MASFDFQIRRATSSDVPAVVELNDGLFHEDAAQRDPLVNLDWAKQYGVEHFASMVAGESSTCFVATAGGDVVGYLAARIEPASAFRPVITADLESIFVKEPYRDRQVGERLVRAFMEWARAAGAQRMIVTAYAANQRAVAFYQRAGFAPQSLTLEYRVDERPSA
jgi:ribosomal protein S18 acetylase RimI-like enzyme